MKQLLIIIAFCISIAAAGQTKTDTTTIVGKVIKIQFVNKGMRKVPGVFDYFFESGNKKYFIKTYKAKYTREQLDKWVDIESEAKGVVIARGTMDDNGEGQSRVGEYLELLNIKMFRTAK